MLEVELVRFLQACAVQFNPEPRRIRNPDLPAPDLQRLKISADDDGITSRVLRPSHRDDLADEILELAVEHDVSLIVIGLRQRTQVGKFIMGSHAQRILPQADRPVLAVKPDGRN